MVGEDIDWGEQNWGFFKRGPPESVRSSGYKNVAYALGELVDNSVEEDATDIDIIMFEKKVTVGGNQRRWYVQQIGTLDNGNGMDPFILRCALRYQDGSAQRGRKRGGSGNAMGKFGVGLPQASISQCRKLEVWSWTDGGCAKANLKNTSNFLPGHGGVLDRLDSILLGIPAGLFSFILFF